VAPTAPAAMVLEEESVAMEAAASCVAPGASASVAPEASIALEATETEVLARKAPEVSVKVVAASTSVALEALSVAEEASLEI